MTSPPPPLPCNRCRSSIEHGDMRCPVCYLAVPSVDRPELATRVQVLRCNSCGASMEYRTAAQAPQCAFCGGIRKLEELFDHEEQIEKTLPFTVDRAQALEIYKQWISRQGFFAPFNLASASRMESLRALRWVGWVVDANVFATWTADSNAGADKAKWAPHSGELQSQFSGLIIPATRGLSANECARLIPTYAIKSATAPSEDGNEQVELERFEMPRSFARARIIGVLERLIDARIQSGEIPGSRFRNLHSSVHLRGLATRRLAFPAYVIAYRYRGELYRTVISGQDPSCVIGEAPRSIAKVLLLIALAIFGVAVFVGLLSMAT